MRDVQYRGDITINVGDILSTVGVFITMGGIMRTVGDILSNLGDVQYSGKIRHMWGYHEYCRECSVLWRYSNNKR